MIQIITFSGKEKRDNTKYVVSKLKEPQSLDEFELNIVDLSDSGLWKCNRNDRKSCDSSNDFKSIWPMILNRSHAQVVIVLPQNSIFHYLYRYDKYHYACELKDMLNDMEVILDELYPNLSSHTLLYENTTTTLVGEKIKAAFYFRESKGLIFSDKSRKNTTIKLDKAYITTLDLNSDNKIEAFLSKLGFGHNKEMAPEWFGSIDAFDDKNQKEIIQECEAIIHNASERIDEARKMLDQNNRYKSILYLSGDELVAVIFDILQDMLGCDLSRFIDEKKEDFLFELGNRIYIGEIKGVNHNVKSANVSQLDVHVQNFLDNHPEKNADEVIALLIINHQKKSAPKDREGVHDTQVELAKRNGSLIIESITLLSIYEAYKGNKLGRNEIIEMLNEKGILIFDK